jgi:predicted amidophosphoribosyltransferase
LWVVAGYDGSTRELLLGLKERGAAGLAAPLGDRLAAAVRAAAHPVAGSVVVVVPVPSQPAAVRRRGDDVVLLMARRAARRLRAEGVEARALPLLVHRRAVVDSAGLSAAQRATNLRGAFALRPGFASALRDDVVVIVDDLVTTGVTLCEAARALCAGGVGVQAAATVAATRRWDR